MSNISHDHSICEQTIRQLEQEVDFLNKQYTITNAERLNYQQRTPSFQISPYHIKLYEQMKNLNWELRHGLQMQQVALAEEQKGFQLERYVGSQNDLLIQRLRQYIYEHEMKILKYKGFLESQKQSVFNLKNRPFLKKEIATQNYGQLKRANDILSQDIVERVRRNQDLELELGQLKRQYDLAQLPRQLGDVRGSANK